MQRLDLGHPGERQLIVGPVALRDDRHLVVAGALERPVMAGGDVLDHCKRVVRRIDDAFEQGHAGSTLPLDALIRMTASTRFDLPCRCRMQFRPSPELAWLK